MHDHNESANPAPATAHNLFATLLQQWRSATVTNDASLLFANTLISAVLGVLFWTLAARMYDVAAVGFTSAVVSTTTLIATLANVGFGPIVLRYLPSAGSRQRRLLLLATLVPASLALMVTALLALVPAGHTIAIELQGHDLLTTLLPIMLVVFTAVMLVQDSICIAQQRAKLVLLRGVGSALVRFGLLIPAAPLGSFGLVAAFTVGVLAAVWLGTDVWRRPPPAADDQLVPARQMAAYGATNYISGIFSQTPQLLYPVLIARYVSHASAGAFAFVWMATALLMALPPSVANVLLTRLSLSNRVEQERQIRQATRTIVVVCSGLALALFVGVVLFAAMVLPSAAAEIQAFLPIMLASSVFYALVRLQSMRFALIIQMRRLLLLNGMVALGALLLPVLLLPRFGVLGLEMGWLLSQAIGAVFGWLLQWLSTRGQPTVPVELPVQRSFHLPALDLVLALLIFFLPALLIWLRMPQWLIAASSTGALLIWPGYVLSQLLWKQWRPNIHLQLALVPLMSLLLIVGISVVAWVLFGQLSTQLVYVCVLVAIAALLLLQLMLDSLPAWSRLWLGSAPAGSPMADSANLWNGFNRQPAQAYRAFIGACLMYLVLSSLMSSVIGWPQPQVQAGNLALYLDPQSDPALNQNHSALDVPLVLANPERAQMINVEIRARFMNQEVVQHVTLAPGEQKPVTLTIPSPTTLDTNQPINVQARTLDANDTRRQLRLWLPAK